MSDTQGAHRTLSNPQLRVRYDARRGKSAGPQIVEITKQINEQLPIGHNGGGGATGPTIPAAAAVETGAFGETPGLDQRVSR